MNSNLAKLISDYLACVKTAVNLMRESGIPTPASNTDWALNGIEQIGELNGGFPYFKHGYGCKVRLPSGIAVDFDFGDRGQIDGFDACRLVHFAGSRLIDYGFASENALNDCFDAEVSSGTLSYSGDILYYIANAA